MAMIDDGYSEPWMSVSGLLHQVANSRSLEEVECQMDCEYTLGGLV